MQLIELIAESDWTDYDRNIFQKRKFVLLTYEQISNIKIGDIGKSDRAQKLLDNLVQEEKIDDKIGSFKTFYAIGELLTETASPKEIYMYNKTLLSMLKNRYSSNKYNLYNKINSIGKCFVIGVVYNC